MTYTCPKCGHINDKRNVNTICPKCGHNNHETNT